MTNPSAKILLINANVITMDRNNPRASIVSIANDKIELVSTSQRIKIDSKKHKVIDCKGRTLIPGFIDAHCHLRSYLESFLCLDLSPHAGIRSIKDIKKKVYEFSKTKPEGSWIKGKNYNEFHLEEKRHPTRFDLDEVTQLHPVRLTHRTGQIHVLNSIALRSCGITGETEDPEEGFIDRDPSTGEPTGILYGMGTFLSKRIPSLDEKELENVVKIANQHLVSIGITSICDATSHNTVNQVEKLLEWKKRELLIPNLKVMIGFEDFGKIKTHKDTELCGVKIILHDVTGRPYPKKEELDQYVYEIHKNGFQIAIHAIEEDQIERAINAIENAIRKIPRDHRHRIEHCSLCPQDLIQRIASLGIYVVSQPSFLYYNGERYLKTVPSSKIKDLYPFRSLIQKGVILASGSDFPVSDPNPFISLYGAIARKAENGDLVNPEEAIDVEEALRMHTIHAAKACFIEHERGSIEPGKIADLVLLSENIEGVTREGIKDVKVVLTIINGKIVYDCTD